MILPPMLFRTATTSDIPQMQIVRNSVKENTLSDPNLVTDADCATFINERGCGWVCVINDTVVGFAIVDLVEHNVWALFVQPEYEGKGIGKTLHNIMLDWYFTQTDRTLWLGTDNNTRAETFYTKQGWTAVGTHGKTEVKFEMTKAGFISTKTTSTKL